MSDVSLKAQKPLPHACGLDTATHTWFSKRQARERLVFACLGALLLVVTFAAISMGALTMSLSQAVAIILSKVGWDVGVDYSKAQESVLVSIRLPRVLLGLLVGATLAIGGAAIQGLFRNPLAEPGLIGTSGGAAMAAVSAIVLTKTFFENAGPQVIIWIVPMAAFLGSLGMTWLVYKLSSTMGRVQVATMLLAGIAINALAFAVMGLAMFLADDSQLRTITFWSLGSIAGATWQGLMIVSPLMLIACFGLPLLARSMDAMAVGEAEAYHLGINVERVRSITIILVALAVGAAVALTGMIGFLGLVVPHMLRMIVGPGHRALLPMSAMLGAVLLVGADLLARTIAQPAELPLGVVTAFLGAPYFLWLLLKNKEGGIL